MIKEELVQLNTEDNTTIALWKIYTDEVDENKNIFLSHGTFSDKKICSPIAKYFAKKGFTCWIMEWRNHGSSELTKKKFNFETIALFEFKTVFSYLISDLRIEKLHCITHSGGGICLTMFLLRNPEYQQNIKSIVFFSCQAFSAGLSMKQKIKLISSKIATYCIGYIPAKKTKLGIYNETYFTMKQWFDWNINNKFTGNDGFNYKSQMKTIKIPIYSICSENDKFISPKLSCEKFIREFSNSNNLYQCFSKANGNLEDYDHGRIILSKNATKEVWGKVYDWINA